MSDVEQSPLADWLDEYSAAQRAIAAAAEQMRGLSQRCPAPQSPEDVDRLLAFRRSLNLLPQECTPRELDAAAESAISPLKTAALYAENAVKTLLHDTDRALARLAAEKGGELGLVSSDGLDVAIDLGTSGRVAQAAINALPAGHLLHQLTDDELLHAGHLRRAIVGKAVPANDATIATIFDPDRPAPLVPPRFRAPMWAALSHVRNLGIVARTEQKANEDAHAAYLARLQRDADAREQAQGTPESRLRRLEQLVGQRI